MDAGHRDLAMLLVDAAESRGPSGRDERGRHTLLWRGVDGSTALHVAATSDAAKKTRMALLVSLTHRARQRELAVRQSFAPPMRWTTHQGVTPLHEAAFKGDDDVIMLLLSMCKGIVDDNGRPPIEWVCDGGWTAMHCAAHLGHVECVAKLVLHARAAQLAANEKYKTMPADDAGRVPPVSRGGAGTVIAMQYADHSVLEPEGCEAASVPHVLENAEPPGGIKTAHTLHPNLVATITDDDSSIDIDYLREAARRLEKGNAKIAELAATANPTPEVFAVEDGDDDDDDTGETILFTPTAAKLKQEEKHLYSNERGEFKKKRQEFHTSGLVGDDGNTLEAPLSKKHADIDPVLWRTEQGASILHLVSMAGDRTAIVHMLTLCAG